MSEIKLVKFKIEIKNGKCDDSNKCDFDEESIELKCLKIVFL